MSTETATTKPIQVSNVTVPVTPSQNAAAGAATHAVKPQPADNHAPVAVATPPKPSGLQLLLEQLTSPDSVERATAATALGRTADIAAVPALIVALNDTDADVARESATSLGLLGDAAAVEPLTAILENRDGFFHSVVRAAATESLGQLRAVVPLLNAVKDPIAEVSLEAIRALASLPDPRNLPALLEVIRNEHGFYLPIARRAAILGLKKIGGEQATCELRFVAANQWEDAMIRATAIEAAGKSSTPSAQGPKII